MSKLLVRQPWVRQPQGFVLPSIWTRQRLISHLSWGAFGFDAAIPVSTPTTITSGGRTITADKYGIATATTQATSTNQTRQIYKNGDFTLLVAATIPTGATGRWHYQVGASGETIVGASFDRLEGGTADNSFSILLLESGVNRSGARAIGVIDGLPHVYLFRKQGAATPRAWVDGKEVTVSNPNADSFAANPTTSADTFRLFGDSTNGAFAPAGAFYASAIFNSALSLGECEKISTFAGMGQMLYRPRRIWLPVNSAAAGATYTFSAGGSFALSGAESLKRIRAQQAGGSFTLSGTQNLVRARVQQVAGGFVLSGTQNLLRTRLIPAAGNVLFSGAAPLSSTAVYIFNASGTVVFAGTVGAVHTKILLATGQVLFTGNAGMIFIPAGGVAADYISRISTGMSRAVRLS